MTTDPATQTGAALNGLAADARSLEKLKRAARDDPRTAVKQVATQFEALFMQMVLKSMREASPKSGLFDSSEQDMYTGMLDQQLSQQVATGGTGLSDVIARQLSRNLPPAAAPAAAGPAPAGAGAPPAPAAAAGVTAGVTTTQQAFVSTHLQDALSAQRASGVPARFILGQAALESGWGEREIRTADGRPSHNLFGIKAGPDWKGATAQVVTTEYEGGVARKTVQTFRAYDSYASAFSDWAATIAGNPRYAAVRQAGASAEGFAAGLQRAGYATDPAYGSKLIDMIHAAAALRGTA
jgi:flagellar protein FlgJ